LADYLDTVSDEELVDILKCLESIIRNSLGNDRVVIPAIEATAGLFEENIFSRLEGTYESVYVGQC